MFTIFTDVIRAGDQPPGMAVTWVTIAPKLNTSTQSDAGQLRIEMIVNESYFRIYIARKR